MFNSRAFKALPDADAAHALRRAADAHRRPGTTIHGLVPDDTN
ncbi:hypothetical protein ACIBQ1_56625 [Nonomuraea sp. NPDC050153]